MKKYAVILPAFQVFIREPFKAQDDEINCAAVIKQNKDKT